MNRFDARFVTHFDARFGRILQVLAFVLLAGSATTVAGRPPDTIHGRTTDGRAPAPGMASGAARLVPGYGTYQEFAPPMPLPQYSRPPNLETRPGDAFADPPRAYPTPPRHYPTPPRSWPQNNPRSTRQ